MQSHGLCFKSLDTPSQHFISKMIHGWLNTGHQCQKLTKDPNSSLFPCCHATNETFEHILQCKSPLVVQARLKAQNPLLTLAQKSFSIAWKVLCVAICNWLKDGDAMQHPCLDRYHMHPGLRRLATRACSLESRHHWMEVQIERIL